MAGLLSHDSVAETIARWAAEPFTWAANCGRSVLDHVERVTGRMLEPAPACDSKAAALRLVLAAGGMEALCADAMAQLGCPPTDFPRRGDVGLVDLAGGVTAAICVARIAVEAAGQAIGERLLWAARGDHLIVIEAAWPIRAWRVACHRP